MFISRKSVIAVMVITLFLHISDCRNGDYALSAYFGIIPLFDACSDGIIPVFTPYFNGIIPLFEG